MGIISKIYCWLFRHNFIEEGKHFNGRSYYGCYRCVRCECRVNWQYDV